MSTKGESTNNLPLVGNKDSNPVNSPQLKSYGLIHGGDSIHAETSNNGGTLHSPLHKELSQGQFEDSQEKAATGFARLSVTHCWSQTTAEPTGGGIWIQRPVGK